MNAAILYYVHDPMCSWCWGFRPTWQNIRNQIPREIPVQNILGGLAPDTQEPMSTEMQTYLQHTWNTIHTKLGTEFNYDFWQLSEPRRSTYPACRAVIAAGNQDAEESMIHAIQKAYYLRAMNPSDDKTLVTLAQELNLDAVRFSQDLNKPDTRKELHRQIQFSQQLGAQGFPSLFLKTGRQTHPVQLDYLSADVVLEDIHRLLED